MKNVYFLSSLFAVLLLTANASAIDLGKIANSAKEEAEKKAKEEAAKAKKAVEKRLKEEAENAVMGTAKKYKGNDAETAREEYAEDKKPVKQAKPTPSPAAAPAVQLNSTVNLAVLETKIDADPALAKEFKPSELRYITQEIRRQSVNNLPKPKFSVMVDSAQLQDNVVSLGEKIDADFIARGIVGKFRKNYTFTVEVYDVGSGKLMLSSEPIESEKAEDLLSGFRKAAPDFFKKLENELKRIEGELSGFRRTASAVPKAPATQSPPAPAAQQPLAPVAQPLLPPATGTSPECQTSYNVFADCQ
jgi:hypothetical protein